MTVLSWEEAARLPQQADGGRGVFSHGAAVAVGSFDGPHRGHGALFSAVREYAVASGCAPGVVTFARPVAGIRRGADYPGDIATLAQRLAEYGRLGLAFAVVIDFSPEFSRMSGTGFLEVLRKSCGVRFIAEGADFRFGHRGACGAAELADFARAHGISVCIPEAVSFGGERISSSRIRNAVSAADFASAGRMLGRPFALDMSGVPLERAGDAARFSRSSVRQVLPPDGLYDVVAKLPVGSLRTRLDVGSRFLHLRGLSDNADPRIQALEFISNGR